MQGEASWLQLCCNIKSLRILKAFGLSRALFMIPFLEYRLPSCFTCCSMYMYICRTYLPEKSSICSTLLGLVWRDAGRIRESTAVSFVFTILLWYHSSRMACSLAAQFPLASLQVSTERAEDQVRLIDLRHLHHPGLMTVRTGGQIGAGVSLLCAPRWLCIVHGKRGDLPTWIYLSFFPKSR